MVKTGMLVLSRMVGEEIVIGDNVRVKVLGVKHGVISIGVMAPRTVSVDRKEVRERKDRKKMRSMQGGGNR